MKRIRNFSPRLQILLEETHSGGLNRDWLKPLDTSGFLNRDNSKVGEGDMERLLLVDGKWEGLAETAHYNSSELARLCGISTRQLQRHFRRSFYCSPQSWLNERRLLAAQHLLLSGESIKKIALDLGFKQPSHFCRQFKIRNKMTPSEFASSQIRPLSL